MTNTAPTDKAITTDRAIMPDGEILTTVTIIMAMDPKAITATTDIDQMVMVAMLHTTNIEMARGSITTGWAGVTLKLVVAETVEVGVSLGGLRN
jgi:hypothetical protein